MDQVIQNPFVAIAIFLCIMVLLIFFSIAEASLLAVNRYRMHHLARQGSLQAKAVESLIKKPDKLLSLLLLGNSFLNNIAATLVTIITINYLGPKYLYELIFLLTIVSLIVVEIAPKTLGTEYADHLAPPSAFLCIPLIKILSPIIWFLGLATNIILLPIRALTRPRDKGREFLNKDEIKSLITMPDSVLHKKHQQMLTTILDLEQINVEEIMIPRQEIEAIDCSRPWSEIKRSIQTASHSILPVFREDYSQTLGVVRSRHLLELALGERLSQETFITAIDKVLYTQEGNSLQQQLNQFQLTHQPMALVLDELGNTIGLVTIDNILEEMIGSHTDGHMVGIGKKIVEESPFQYLIHGSTSLRMLNRYLPITFNTQQVKTFNGYILNKVNEIPTVGTVLREKSFDIEVTKKNSTMVLWARLTLAKTQDTSDGKKN
ncbi:MAG: CNNM domain-containing protein [Methylacidiphilales bacterium]|nr:CNNM domain-containing protein [Candidatus Methylacidiphilales bacterium]